MPRHPPRRRPPNARLAAVALVIATGLTTACTASAVQNQGPGRVFLAGFNPLAPALAEALHRKLPDIAFTHFDNGLARSNVEKLQDGSADLGLTFADIAYIGFTGRLEGHPQRLDHLRGIAVLQLTPVHLIVRSGSLIGGLDDLCGKTVAVGVAGSGTSLTAALLLASHACRKPVVRKPLLYTEAVQQLMTGEVDAMFVIQGYPSDSVQAAMHVGGRIVDISGPSIKRLRSEYPFLRPAMIPAGTYPAQPRVVHTVGVDMLLACRSGLDETLVYRITKGLFDSLPELSAKVTALRLMEIDRSTAMPIPLHDGAARYYRERELTR